MSKQSPKKSKVTYTLFVNEAETPEEIQKKLLARRIKVLAVMKGEVMADWAKEIGVTRHAVYHVVEGRRKTPRIRRVIEAHLGQRIWNDEEESSCGSREAVGQ